MSNNPAQIRRFLGLSYTFFHTEGVVSVNSETGDVTFCGETGTAEVTVHFESDNDWKTDNLSYTIKVVFLTPFPDTF